MKNVTKRTKITNAKRLVLQPETIRVLSDRDIRAVAGGMLDPSNGSACHDGNCY